MRAECKLWKLIPWIFSGNVPAHPGGSSEQRLTPHHLSLRHLVARAFMNTKQFMSTKFRTTTFPTRGAVPVSISPPCPSLPRSGIAFGSSLSVCVWCVKWVCLYCRVVWLRVSLFAPAWGAGQCPEVLSLVLVISTGDDAPRRWLGGADPLSSPSGELLFVYAVRCPGREPTRTCGAPGGGWCVLSCLCV